MPSSVDSSPETSVTPQSPPSMEYLNITSSLEDLQTDEQRKVLDTVAHVRKCGLDSILSLPQLVVCGDQSAGKSSVLEAITKIPFPRNDNLCTRFATEIILRNSPLNSLTIKVIPDETRPQSEKNAIQGFNQSITDFGELPTVMNLAMDIMGISATDSSNSPARAFSRDVLSVEIEGPSQPQLMLVDIPGLIQSSTKGVSDADIELVAEITDHYISQPRTICLAVVSATNDAANQPILKKVRQYDPKGDRTLGIITKPDRLPAGSGSETKFLELARNEDVFFKLGWHVLKNRSFEEGNSSFMERNAAEATYFRTSNFKSLPRENVGIEALKTRLVTLLFDHVKQELPRLREDLEKALVETRNQHELLGIKRSAAAECKTYLIQLSMDYYETCKAAVNGHYEGAYFHSGTSQPFSLKSPATISRLRAVIQFMNNEFQNNVRKNGHKYQIDMSDNTSAPNQLQPRLLETRQPKVDDSRLEPTRMNKTEALQWIRQALIQSRGKELQGNFNPLIIGELFWEQASNWEVLAKNHAEDVAEVCERFLEDLLTEKCPKDVKTRIWSSQIGDALDNCRKAASQELDLIMEDVKSFPINYNHYYTDTIHKRREERQKASLEKSLDSATEHTYLPGCNSNHTSASINVDQVMTSISSCVDPNMDNFSYEEVLDCLFAIYKVSQKTFIANVTTQVVERHIVRNLEKIFSPMVVSSLTDAEVEAIAMEPSNTKRQRDFLEDRIKKLESGYKIFKTVMVGSAGSTRKEEKNEAQ